MILNLKIALVRALAVPEKVDHVVASIDDVVDKSGGVVKDLEALGIKAKLKIGTYDWNSLNSISGPPSADLPLVPEEEPGILSRLKNPFGIKSYSYYD